jgi:hypothetical protein
VLQSNLPFQVKFAFRATRIQARLALTYIGSRTEKAFG